MQLKLYPPKRTLNKAFLKEKVSRNNIEVFKLQLSGLLSKIDVLEREEHHKYPFSDFLKNVWYKNLYEINTKGDLDFVIHDGNTTRAPVGALIEVKRPSNITEMISRDKPNVKALHELILYYLRERIDHGNDDIKNLIITNIYEWYIIDENWFNETVFHNSKLRSDYERWRLSGKKTKYFYDDVAKPFLDALKQDIPVTWFDIRDYQKSIVSNDKVDDIKLIALYKILAPEHLLKKRLANDNNSLDTKFYTELLHIIGLEEVDEGGKKIIGRKKAKELASLIENTIMMLGTEDRINNVRNLLNYGVNRDEQLEAIGLEFCITWVNRILFLKLLEAQLAKYHSFNPEYLFLNINTIADFKELNELFFLVLAEKPENRLPYIKSKFSKIPYLNSSLFEKTQLEKDVLNIGDLSRQLELTLLSDTVITADNNKRRKGSLPTLRYLFEFLNAYDFSSEGSEAIQEEGNKRLISASVLGLIFEKINGYKDGSFFTPSYITMYMCREVIQKKLIQKFNKEFSLDCESLTDLKNFTNSRYKTADILHYNRVVDDIKICDPAVGSGHFLVSALNEILFVKAELGILADEKGEKLDGYELKIDNDELIITYNENTEIFAYKVLNNRINPKIQRVQKTIFQEKQRIIENSLFGVDINHNSVKICSLRLWIELLKNAYYTEKSGFLELETLPNIDINIKPGNSLIYKSPITTDLADAFKNTDVIKRYKDAVQDYKSTNDKQKKLKIVESIEQLKNQFKDKLDKKFLSKIAQARGKVIKLEADINSKKEWNETITPVLKEKLKKAKATLDKTKLEKESILDNVNYKHSFEWRFEFPEVLNEVNYKFEGFDIIIGNPPYGVKLTNEVQNTLKKIYKFGTIETAILFIKHGFDLLKHDGIQTYIIPKSYSFASNYESIRNFTLPYLSSLIDCGKVWSDVKLEVCIFELQKSSETTTYRNLTRTENKIEYITAFNKSLVQKYGFLLNNITTEELKIAEKILSNCIYLNSVANNRRGEGLQRKVKIEGEIPILGGIDISRYKIKSHRGFIDSSDYSLINDNARIHNEGILVQNIVAHITTPYPRVKITACIPTNNNYVILDTINQITSNSSKYSKYVIWALLNSTLINWFVYLFIYGKAIRTMHFDNVITSRIPVPEFISPEAIAEIESISKTLTVGNAGDEKIEELEKRLNLLIFEIFGLSEAEISIVEPNKKPNHYGQTLLERSLSTPMGGGI